MPIINGVYRSPDGIDLSDIALGDRYSFGSVRVDFSKKSAFWLDEQAKFKRKGPRWASPLYKSKARAAAKEHRRDPTFYHQATLTLSSGGMSGPAIAAILGISLRSVRYHLTTPCAALDAEHEETRKRERREHYGRTKQGKAPFDVWAYLGQIQSPMIVEELGFDPWATGDIGSTTREKVAFYLMDDWTQSEISRLLDISRQAVSKHAISLRGTQR